MQQKLRFGLAISSTDPDPSNNSYPKFYHSSFGSPLARGSHTGSWIMAVT